MMRGKQIVKKSSKICLGKKGQKDAYVNREEAKSQDENDEESTYDDEKADSEEGFKDLPRQTVKTKDMPCTFDEPADDTVTVLSSSGDAASDSDYICGNEDVHSTESEITDDGQSAIVENSTLLQNERDGLLTKLVEVIGEKTLTRAHSWTKTKDERTM